MIAFIKGEIVSARNGTIILENGGIGYELSVSASTMVKANSQGKEIQLFSFMNVKEDGIALYGFYSLEEKGMFMKLISVTGVGPKAAMGILSGIELTSLVTAIITKDIKTLSTVKGIGKKTAERLVLELRESLEADFETDTAVAAGELDEIPADRDSADAVLALRSLGIGQKEAVNAVRAAKSRAKNIEELISIALKNL
ncbi:MAG: Holliday junction branch migration protein RuvA [Clostridia bacterium]|nr:Holliday junction branch migration protein RuvA [Clostridia bacterium]